MKKIGILGGTFDPPHNGHLIIAQEVLTALKLNEIWFMPTNIPPHKKEAVSSGENRIEMVRLAIENNPFFRLQTIEFERSGPSYTVDTMKLLVTKYPQHTFYFIIGGDMVEYLPNWHGIDQLMDMVMFVGVKRPGYSIQSPYPVLTVEVPQLEISSSFLRERFEKGLNTKYYLPENVRTFVEENGIYGSK